MNYHLIKYFFILIILFFPISNDTTASINSTASKNSKVAAHPNGFIIAYEKNTDVCYQKFNFNGIKEGSEIRANTFTTNTQQIPSITSYQNGKAVIVWESINQLNTVDVYFQQIGSNGSKVGSETIVNTFTDDGQQASSVAPLQS